MGVTEYPTQAKEAWVGTRPPTSAAFAPVGVAESWVGCGKQASPVGRHTNHAGNPVKRGLVEKPEDRSGSSFGHYLTGAECVVEVESLWTGRKRERMGTVPQVKDHDTVNCPARAKNRLERVTPC